MKLFNKICVLLEKYYQYKMNMIEKFCDNIEASYYNIKYGLKNLIKYFKLVWNDRDWDYQYMLEFLSFKAKNMSKLHKNYGISLSSDDISKDLEYFSYLCNMLSKKHTPFADSIYRKFGEVELNRGNKDSNGLIEIIFTHKNIKNGKYTQEQFDKEFQIAIQKDEKLHNRYNRQFLKYISKYEEWWD